MKAGIDKTESGMYFLTVCAENKNEERELTKLVESLNEERLFTTFGGSSYYDGSERLENSLCIRVLE